LDACATSSINKKAPLINEIQKIMTEMTNQRRASSTKRGGGMAYPGGFQKQVE